MLNKLKVTTVSEQVCIHVREEGIERCKYGGVERERSGGGGGEKIGRKEKDDTLYVKCLLLLTNRTTSKARCND